MFEANFRFRAKLNRKQSVPLYFLSPTTPTPHYSGSFVIIDIPASEWYQQQRNIIFIMLPSYFYKAIKILPYLCLFTRGLSLGAVPPEFWQTYNDTHALLRYHKEQFHCSKNLCAPPVRPSPSLLSPLTVPALLPFQSVTWLELYRRQTFHIGFCQDFFLFFLLKV